MVFVFTIGMLKQYMPRREVLLVLLVAFLIGSIGGAFFLDPIHDELPVLINVVEKNINENNETLYLDFSSSVDIDKLKKTLSKTDGFISFDENAISIPMWTFNEKEHSYFERVVGNINSHYKNYNITKNTIVIELDDNISATEALKSFSNWYKIVYGDSIAYAQYHTILVVESKSLDTFERILLDNGIVASNIEGPLQDSLNKTNSSMLTNVEITLIGGCFGIIVAILGIYADSVIPFYRRFKKSFRRKRKR